MKNLITILAFTTVTFVQAEPQINIGVTDTAMTFPEDEYYWVYNGNDWTETACDVYKTGSVCFVPNNGDTYYWFHDNVRGSHTFTFPNEFPPMELTSEGNYRGCSISTEFDSVYFNLDQEDKLTCTVQCPVNTIPVSITCGGTVWDLFVSQKTVPTRSFRTPPNGISCQFQGHQSYFPSTLADPLPDVFGVHRVDVGAYCLPVN